VRLVDGDIEELGDAAHLSWHVAFQVGEVHEQDVREVAELPPGAHVLPGRPEEGVAVAVHPVAEVLPDVPGGGSMGGPTRPGVSLSRSYQSWFALAWWLYMLQTTSRPSRPM
jgi:hypothetical protein